MLDKMSENNIKDKIIEAATKLFERKGYHSTTIQEISIESGISKGGLFHYYKSKEEILFRIHEIIVDYELSRVEIVLNKNLDTLQTLKELIEEHVESIGKFKSFLTVFYQEKKSITDSKKVSSINEKRGKYESIFLSLVEKGINNGELRADINPVIIVKTILGTCNWSYQWLSPEGSIAPKDIGSIFWNIIFNGIRKDPI